MIRPISYRFVSSLSGPTTVVFTYSNGSEQSVALDSPRRQKLAEDLMRECDAWNG